MQRDSVSAAAAKQKRRYNKLHFKRFAIGEIYILKSEASVCVPRSQRALTLYTQRQTALLRPLYPVSAVVGSSAVKYSSCDVGVPVSQKKCA